MTTGFGEAATDGLLTTRLATSLPTPMAQALRHAISRSGSDAERFSRRMQFTETVLRMLVAVQDAERVALELEPPGELRQLLNMLERPTLGGWRAAAEGLARVLADQKSRLLPDVGRGLRVDETGRASMRDALNRLIDIRNRVAHGGDLGALPDAIAPEWLQQTNAPLRDLVLALDSLCRLRLVVFTHAVDRIDDQWTVRIVAFRGDDPAELEEVVQECPRPLHQPVLIARNGGILRLCPWMVDAPLVGRNGLQLLERWQQGGPTYSVPGTGMRGLRWDGRKRSQERAGLGPAEWVQRYLPSRRLKKLDVALTQKLHRSHDPDAPPEVRDLEPRHLLGRGGTGAVWRVVDPARDDAQLALKVLHPTLATRPEHIARLQREYEVLSGLRVEGIVRVEEFMPATPSGPCLLMHCIDGESLAQRIRREPMALQEAVWVVRRALVSLGEAHRRGIVHRDIKPSNILIDGSGCPWLIDFGVARTDTGETLTLTVEVVGTLRYMAPEQRRGERARPAADVYGMAKVLTELLGAGEGGTKALKDAPGSLQRVLRKALQDEPDERYMDAAAFAEALDAAMGELPRSYPLGVGDKLPGGIVLTSEGPEVGERIRIFRGHNRMGRDRSVLVPAADDAARRRLMDALRQRSDVQLHQHGCSGWQETDDGLPFAVLSATEDIRHAAELLGAPASRTASPPRPAPRVAPPADPWPRPAAEPPAPEPEPGPSPSIPSLNGPPMEPPAAPEARIVDDDEETEKVGGEKRAAETSGGAEAALVFGALGALAAGAVAAHALSNAGAKKTPKAAPRPRASSASPLLAALRVLGGSKAKKRPEPTPLPPEYAMVHSRALLLLAFELRWGTLKLQPGAWPGLVKMQLGGLLALLGHAKSSPGEICRALSARADSAELEALAVELHRLPPAGLAARKADLVRLANICFELMSVAGEGNRKRPDAAGPLLYRKTKSGALQVQGVARGQWVDLA